MSGYRATIAPMPRPAMIAVEAGLAALAACAAALGVDLPAVTGAVRLPIDEDARLVRPGPESLTLIGPRPQGAALLGRLRDAAAADRAAIVEDVTQAHGWTIVAGEDWRPVLSQGVAIDLRDPAVPVGAVLRTLCFGVEALLHRTGPAAIAIGTRSSLAPFLEARLRLAADPAAPPPDVGPWR